MSTQIGVPNREVYATQPRPLRDQITGLLRTTQAEDIGEITAIVVPDTNLIEGGNVAARVYKLLEGRSYDTVILVAPSHTGSFGRINICNVDSYHTPLGELPVNDQVRNELCDEDDDIFLDNRGHFHTQGIDVQLPFLQTVLAFPFDIVPIVMGDESPEFCDELGQAIGEVMYNRRALVVASIDILHAEAEALDQFKHHLEAGDVSRLRSLLNSESVLLEGKGPLLVALIVALRRHVNHMQILGIQAPQNGTPGFLGSVLWRG